MSLDEIRHKVATEFDEQVREIPHRGRPRSKLPYSYHMDVLRVIKEIRRTCT
jgi:hypothetical protein